MSEYSGDITTNRGVVVQVHIENVGDLASLSFRDCYDDRGRPVLKLGKGDRRSLIDLLTESLPAPARTEQQLLRAYEEGQRAYDEGQASNSCPYRNIAMGDRWDAGWSNSKTDDPGAEM